ncbi:MAG: nicotinate-nucleotide diphosphorylase [Thermoguttaceae bacterium]
MRDFRQEKWDSSLEHELRRLLRISVPEDIGVIGDLTSIAIVPIGILGDARVCVRQQGVLAGVPAVPIIIQAIDPKLQWESFLSDGDTIQPGNVVGILHGPARSLLTAERQVLNLLGRLSGIATLTRKFVDAIDGTGAKIYDTRKTTLGWRRLDKYAVKCGGGRNHRTGLFDAILIKDNHLAFGCRYSYSNVDSDDKFSPFEAVQRAKDFLQQQTHSLVVSPKKHSDDQNSSECLPSILPENIPESPLIEIEVDTLFQLREVLPAAPDIVLLDNMGPAMLREAVLIRDRLKSRTELEASGGVSLETVRAIAETKIDRISVGALTHSAIALDFGLDWGK